MTEYIKIKCDDCKFVENCVDYGWQECKKFTPKQSEPMTNEEWFNGLSTEEKARFLDRICYSAWGDRNSRFKDMADYTDWVEWLKEKHE